MADPVPVQGLSESILTSVKKLLGIAEEYTHFDADVIMHINTALMVLYQLGVGAAPFRITDKTAVWSDFLGDATDLEGVKTYIAQKVKLAWDTPQSGTAIQALEKNIAELEWRLNVAVDPRDTFTATMAEVNAHALANRAEITAFERQAARLGE